MKFNYKKITKYTIGIIMLFSLMISTVSAQEMWYLRSSKLRPNVSTWGLQVPSLNNSGTKCLQVNATGVISAYSTGCGGGGGGGSSPLTTKGEIYTFDTADAALAVGTNGQILTADSSTATGLKWNTNLAGNAGTATALQTPRTIGGVSFDGTGNITVATATGGFTVSGGNLALGTNSLTLTGSIGATGARSTKGWFTDLEITNAPTIGGISATGSGGLVRATSPTLVTPILGTPTSVTLTNGTGLPISTGLTGAGTGVLTALGINVGSAGSILVNGGVLGTPSSGTLTNATGLPISTGVSGLGAGVATFLATPSSVNLATALTGETGTGGVVFNTSPTIVTPTIAKLANLTSNGFVKTSLGDGTLSVDTNTYLTGNQSITLSGDVSGSGTTGITTTIGNDKVLEAMLKAVDSPADEECLTYEATGGDFEWQTCGGGGGSSALSGITAATGTNTIDNTNYAQNWDWSTLTTQTGLAFSANAMSSGTLHELTSTSTAAPTTTTYSGSHKMLGINMTGTNATTNAVTYGLYVLNAKLGTTSKNYAIHADTTNASGLITNIPFMWTGHLGGGAKVGNISSTEAGMWFNSVTPSTTNYTISFDSTTAYFNSSFKIRSGASNQAGMNGTGVWFDAGGGNVASGGQRLISRNNATASANYGSISLGNQGNWAGGGTTPFSGSSNGTHFAINEASGFAGDFVNWQKAGTSKFKVTSDGLAVFETTITAGGTTGNQTINKPTGTVNIAAAGTSVTVTNSVATANSIVFATPRTNDATCAVKNVVPSAGSFVITMTDACTAETSIGFMVINN